MKRRTYLTAVGGGLATLVGCTAAAEATRADVGVDAALVRGKGDPITTKRAIDRESVEYLEKTDEIRDGDDREPFERWARRECTSVGAIAVLRAIEARIGNGTPIEGIGKGVRSLLFGSVVTVDHVVTRDRAGSVTSEPSVGFEKLVATTPRTVTTTIVLGEREYTSAVPAAVEHVEYREQ